MADDLETYRPIHPRIDWPMYDDPRIDDQPVPFQFDARLTDYWLDALARPETNLQFRAVEAMLRAHTMGMSEKDLASRVVGPLTAVLEAQDRPIIVQRAAVETLGAMDARQSAPAMRQANQRGDREVVQLTDKTLARWNDRAARALWLKRIQSPQTADFLRISAIDAVNTVRDAQAAPALTTIATDRRVASPVRIAAAQALGAITQTGLLDDAKRLAGSEKVLDRTIAAHMLAGHRDAAARSLLLTLADDLESPGATIALRAVLADDPMHLAARVEQLMRSKNGNHRQIAVAVLEARATADDIVKLVAMINDANTPVRRKAATALLNLAANPGLQKHVLEHCMRVLAGDNWRGISEAALILGRLDHQPATELLVRHMTHDHHEARLSAIVALRWINESSSHGAMLERATYMLDNQLKPGDPKRSLELAQLFQALAIFKYRKADPAMRKLMPLSTTDGGLHRFAAVWSLGKMYESEPNAPLAAAFAARIADVHGRIQEDPAVRRFSAIGIGRMKTDEQNSVLREFYSEVLTTPIVKRACHWALQEIEGKTLPPPPVKVSRARGWFIEPIPD